MTEVNRVASERDFPKWPLHTYVVDARNSLGAGCNLEAWLQVKYRIYAAAEIFFASEIIVARIIGFARRTQSWCGWIGRAGYPSAIDPDLDLSTQRHRRLPIRSRHGERRRQHACSQQLHFHFSS